MVCCEIFLDSFDSGDWRSLLRFNTIPALLCVLGGYFLLRESPRLYVARGDFERGFEELNLMGITNSRVYVPLSDGERQGLIQWQETHLK
jgi:hypothetical protein